MDNSNNKCKVIDLQAWREKKAAEKAERDRIESPVIEAATEDIQETRVALDGLIAGMVADAHEAGLTIQELGDLIEAKDMSGFCSDDNLFISKQAFLNALGELGWRSVLSGLSPACNDMLKELMNNHLGGLNFSRCLDAVLEKRVFNGVALSEKDIVETLKIVYEQAQKVEAIRDKVRAL